MRLQSLCALVAWCLLLELCEVMGEVLMGIRVGFVWFLCLVWPALPALRDGGVIAGKADNSNAEV